MTKKKTELDEVTPTSAVERPSRKRKAGGETAGETFAHQVNEKRSRHTKEVQPWRKSPINGDNALNLQPGDNTKYIGIVMKIRMLPKIDLNDIEQVEQRTMEYLQIYADADTKPTIVGFANALGISRQELYAVRTGNWSTMGGGYLKKLPQDVVVSLKRTASMLEEMWESYMQNGKINPVSGIFLGKNHFGYRDQSDLVVAPRTEEASTLSLEDIRSRYNDSDDVIDSE